MTLASEQPSSNAEKPLNFLEQTIKQDLEKGKYKTVVTRFPPEPNGYLHIGHAKSICLNFGLAQRFGGQCHLRFDDTNPAKEEQHYIDAIIRDVQWLGFQWAGDIRYSSQYFQHLYQWAVYLIEQGKAYVCHLSAEQTRLYRGTLTAAGTNSPYRERSIEDNLIEFEKMRAGDYAEGACVLRAKIDMANPNINLRDPTLYRIRKQAHHQTGDHWCIYPTYDFAHGQGDALEGVTHSICTLEFQDHRPLYDWFIENLPVPAKPRQYEFGRLNINYTVTSKRKLKQLVDEGHVDAWDDPRMPTIAGLRRRGVSAAALRTFCDMIGATKSDGIVDIAMLEHAIRDDLDKNAARAMCVLHPLTITLSNYPEDKTEIMVAPGHPQRDDLPERQLPFSRTLLIDAADFREQANKHYKRLVLGKRVRLRNAYVIEADECVKDDSGTIIEIKARIIEGSLGNNPEDGIKPKGVIHWVDAKINTPVQLNLYERLFTHEAPDAGDKHFLDYLNPESLQKVTTAVAEVGLQNAQPGQRYQFEREGYFVRDNGALKATNTLVFNRTIGLRDTFAKNKKS
ncbi:MAG: glutamine--tRNA ligase/YqeY domain fusion protein [Cellvibrionaceae bacterium]|nr:glutamine--tRNA ligase/YqeY domain fusion protein [Cellvibrionaceae bacterium]